MSASQSKTYGERPRRFQLTDGGDYFYIGSEVGSYLKFFRGTLYKKYPQLWKRLATGEEKRQMGEMNCANSYLNTNIMLVKADEVEDILAGADDKYKAVAFGTEHHRDTSHSRSDVRMSTPQHAGTSSRSRGANQSQNTNNTAYMGQVSSGAHHLDAVPCSTHLPHARVGHKKMRTFPHCFDDTDPVSLHANADQPELLVPIRLDMEIDGIKLRDFFSWNKNGWPKSKSE